METVQTAMVPRGPVSLWDAGKAKEGPSECMS